MKSLLLGTTSGISGDMMVSALIDLGLPVEVLASALTGMGLPSVRPSARRVAVGPISAMSFVVEDSAGLHLDYRQMVAILRSSRLGPRAQELSLAILGALARAEARIHGCAPDEVTFHEISAADTIADAVGVALGFEYLEVGAAYVATVETGCGTTLTRHGVMPVPSPATLELLAGFEITSRVAGHELTTPTGAAILSVVGRQLGASGPHRIERTGYGSGTLRLEDRPNVLVATLAATAPSQTARSDLVLLESNVDDRSAELLAATLATLIGSGALDAWIVPIVGKKGRPAYLLGVLCHPADAERLSQDIFAATGTLGVRQSDLWRREAERHQVEVALDGRIFRVKVGQYASKIEFDDLAEAAAVSGRSILEISRTVALAFNREHPGLPMPQ